MAINKIEYNGNTLIDLSEDKIKEENLLSGVTAHDAAGEQIIGKMPNNGDVSKQFSGLTENGVDIPAGYTVGGRISLTDEIERALAAI